MASPEELDNLRRQLMRALARRCPPWLSDQREDIAQVAMMRLVHIMERGERTTPFPSSYLWKVACSAMIDEIRRLRRRAYVPLGAEGTEPVAQEARCNPERAGAGQEIGRGIRDCLAALGVPRRRAVTLHLLGHSVPEITRLMAWTFKRAENLVYRGLDDLRKCLTAKGLAPTGETRADR